MVFQKFFKKDRRKGPRVPLRVKIFLNILPTDQSEIASNSVEGEIKNISTKGACVLLPTMTIEGHHLFMGNDGSIEHKLVLSLPDEETGEGLSIPIEMKWYKDTEEGEKFPFEAGVQFSDLPFDKKQKLKQFLKKHY
ncbi:MAG TPA: PilZ domain-containing protein [Deltaproteobacteria bacterium]|nr:MAG: hypothetical protein DRG83_19335 [Deltaproteobacteria bacterium]HEC32418.1 PilZ domain-containing protein [Deltaproteobacteria bacterium]